MVRYLFLLHRYLGIGIGLVMLLWTLSGIIMMYKSYPELDRWELLSLRDEIQLDDCCSLHVSETFQADTFSNIRLEMLSDSPVLRMNTVGRGLVSYDLKSGRSFIEVDALFADSVSREFVRSRYTGHSIVSTQTINNDQWTVYSSYHPHRPLHKYRINDPANTEFYVSSRTGEIVQLTTAEQRLWGYLGAVIHWLYPTVLRQHTAVWAQVVIWLTIIGIFLTVTGIYIGLRQYRHRSSGRLSPYRGLQRYHHYAGLLFGIFTLSWVASGLLSMNPWGALEGEGTGLENRRLSGDALTWSEVQPILQSLSESPLPADSAMLEIFPQQSSVNAVVHTIEGDKFRLNSETTVRDTLTPGEVRSLAEIMHPLESIRTIELLTEEDYYYYVHHEPREFPVYKVVFDDDQSRHYYLSAVDGRIQLKVDGNLRLYRWLFHALHRGDFSVLARSRPVWDLFMLFLLTGVTVVCATGTCMGWRRLRTNQRIKQSRTARLSIPAANLISK
jgi:uncharacterized iron-regulated membrane protein